MGFRSINEFREALAGVALRNPSLRLPDGSVLDMTVEEARELIPEVKPGRRRKGLAVSGAPEKRKRRSSRKPTLEQLDKYAERRGEDEAISYKQAALLARAMGGMPGYAPGAFEKLQAAKKKGVKADITNVRVFSMMGFNYNLASDALSALRTAGLLGKNEKGTKAAKEAKGIVALYASAEAAAKLAKNNPRYDIPLSFPVEDYQYAPQPRLAHRSSYPQYSYDQFYRPNTPRTPFTGPSSSSAEAGTGTSVAICNGAPCPTCKSPRGRGCVTASGNPTRPHSARRRGARQNPVPVPIPPSAAGARPVEWEMAQNAGPFLPEMFPYGQGGRPVTYAVPNPRSLACPLCGSSGEEPCYTRSGDVTRPHAARIKAHNKAQGQAAGRAMASRARGLGPYARRNPITEKERRAAQRSGGTLSGNMGWPVKVPGWSASENRNQAITAMQFMLMGHGDPSKYGSHMWKMAELFPIENSANRDIWTFYRKNRDRMGKRMPTIAALRKISTKRKRR